MWRIGKSLYQTYGGKLGGDLVNSVSILEDPFLQTLVLSGIHLVQQNWKVFCFIDTKKSFKKTINHSFYAYQKAKHFPHFNENVVSTP